TDALRAIPGVTDVSSGTLLPFSGSRYFDVFIQEERGDQGSRNPASAFSIIEDGFERALGMHVLSGRAFLASDDSSAERVLMINDVIAKRDYRGVDPIGKTINWNGQPHWRIVGVVGSVRINQLWEEALPVVYV